MRSTSCRISLGRLSAGLSLALALLGFGSLSRAAEQEPEFAAKDLEFFEKQIRPLLVKRCYECHGPDAKRLEGGLLMTSRAALLEGGDTGPALAPGKPAESLLVDAINYGELYEMPPKGKLPKEEIALLTRWVEMGAPWPDESSSSADPREKFDLQARRASHWAWQPVGNPEPPAVKDESWPLDPLDRFILARLEKEGLRPNPPARPRTLLRRLYFDLIGLPPTVEEIADFEQRMADWRKSHPKQQPSGAPLAVLEEVVDRLLASPHFGERWGRHWLDLVRYAESRGHEFDYNAPNAWEYRDYVIRAFNADVPYDQLVVEHVAGDLLDNPRTHPEEGFNESIIGSGFWHLGEWVHSPVDIRKDECDRLDNQLDVLGKAFLGMTVACARCHDHKFDAISQRDYYALAGFVQSSAYRLARFETLGHNQDIAEQLQKLRDESGRELARLTFDAQRGMLEELDKYLLAARETIVNQSQNDTSLAQQHGLNAAALAAWVAHLSEAKGNADDPLHLWARLAFDSNQGTAHLAQSAAAAVREMKQRAETAHAAGENIDVIIDYGNCQPGEWMTDGSAFGLRPARIGEPLLSADRERPLAGFAWYGAARRDPAFRGLKVAPGSQNDQGSVGSWQRAGQSIRTPTFTIQDGPVHYLVRGAGRAWAVVDSHRMVKGPLHGEVLYQWKGDDSERPRWVTHNLARQKGHRAHVEFSPSGDGDLEILMVAQGPRPPALPIDAAGSGLLAESFSALDELSLPDIAGAYQTLFREVAERAARGFADDAPGADAAVADWMIQHPKLFRMDHFNGDKSAQPLQQAGERFVQQHQRLAAQIRKTSRVAMAMWDGSGEDELLLIRGNHGTPGGAAPRRPPAALGGERFTPPNAGSGRLRLARQIVDPSNPLTARVMVNRIWHHLTGRGIVPSTDNFGVLGNEPTHPGLLDHLARRFMTTSPPDPPLARGGSERGSGSWSIKQMIKTVVLSRTYQMSSRPSEADRSHPANELLHRMRIRRLEGEAIRDAMLAVSGRLERKMFGPPVPVHLTPFMTGRGRPRSGPLDGAGRRSIYISIRRNFLSPMMLAFDVPQPSSTTGRRTESNVPAQALIMMNDPLVVQQAELWAKRLLSQQELSPAQRVEEMYLAAFSRRPSEEETAAALAFLDQQAARYGLPENQRRTALPPWADLCHVMFNVKEFIFVN